MSHAKKWKMLHLLHTRRASHVNEADLIDAGVDCVDDTIEEIINAGLAKATGKPGKRQLSLTRSAIEVLNSCVVARRTEAFSRLVMVDYPSAFVIMPFREKWSVQVSKAIRRAVEAAGLRFIRGDTALGTSSLLQTVVGQIMQAGLVIADLSAPNVNVFYEVGIAHALGKDSFVLKQRGVRLPADIQGARYYPYSLKALQQLETTLTSELKLWGDDHRCLKVKQLSMAPDR